jgi:hypothetical protein
MVRPKVNRKLIFQDRTDSSRKQQDSWLRDLSASLELSRDLKMKCKLPGNPPEICDLTEKEIAKLWEKPRTLSNQDFLTLKSKSFAEFDTYMFSHILYAKQKPAPFILSFEQFKKAYYYHVSERDFSLGVRRLKYNPPTFSNFF